MADFPKLVEIERDGSRYTFKVDGVEFPWYVSDTLIVPCKVGEMPGVTITLLADEVRVVNKLASDGRNADR